MTTCTFARSIDRHFAATISTADERALREHLPACDRCRARYERWLVMAKLDPRALSAERRIAAGLGIAPKRARWVVPALAFAAAVLVVVALRTPDELQPRGHGTPQLLIYRVPAHAKAPVRVTDRIHVTDELAFAFENPQHRARLLVFGVDEHRHIVWYHPSWVDPALDPIAVKIQSAGELQEAIGHDLDGTTLTVYGLFTDRAIGVREVERAVREQRDLATLGAVHATALVVERP